MCMDEFTARLKKADDLAELHQRVGFTLWQLQTLEEVAAQYFVLSTQATNGMGEMAGNALLSKARKSTFGGTIAKMAKSGVLDEKLHSKLLEILDQRNWLVHRSLNDSYYALQDYVALLKLVTRIENIAREAMVLMKNIASLAEVFVKDRGISSMEIDRMTKELLDEWATSDAY